MKSKNEWRTDKEYVSIVADLLAQPAVQKLANYTQHHHSTRLQHSIAVSYDSYKIAKKMHILLKEKLNIDGMSIIQNNGDVQEVKHYHMHLKPYYKENNGISVEEVYKKLIG